MATGFNTQTGGGQYRLQFETDNEEYFLLMQELARCCVDHPPHKTNADRIRAMSDEELADFLNRIAVNHHIKIADECRHCPLSGAKPCDTEGVINWLQQPVEELNDGK